MPPPARQTSPITRVETREPAVALTFDACATMKQANSFDRAIFDVLRAESVPATIFVSGRWVQAHPEVMFELSKDALFEFGGHSYQHPHMANMPAVAIAGEIDKTEAALARYGKKSVAFRPPFGEWSQRVLDVVREKRLQTVLWDVVSGDPSVGTTADRMTREVLRRTKPGSIVIFHINGRGHNTAEALPDIVRGLRARGLRFVPLSELLARKQPLLVASGAKGAPQDPAGSEPPAFVAPAPKPLGPAHGPGKGMPVATAPVAPPPAATPPVATPPAAPPPAPVAARSLPEKPAHPDDTLPLSPEFFAKPDR
ncbi:MAG TPA: polysaccharide deacetylase family protein [Polyangia bacterium]|nr:polysaccharide deacetylase family protein [Polyangia bacterium]